MKKLIAIAIAAALSASLIGLALAGQKGPELHEIQADQYCQDVAQWQYEQRHNVPMNQRTGTPDWRDIADTACR